MASQDCLPGTGHRNDPRLSDTRAFKALVDRKAEYKGITFREAAAHLRCVLDYARVGRNQVLLGIAVGQGGRALGKLGDVIGTIGFGRSTELGDGFDSVANLRSGIVIDGAFDHSLIIINEQARGSEFLRALFALVELDCARNAVAGAASELPLVIYRRAFGSPINGGRQPLREADEGCPIHEIAVTGRVSAPAISAMGRRPTNRKFRQCTGGDRT